MLPVLGREEEAMATHGSDGTGSDASGRSRRLAGLRALGALALAGALVSCGGGRGTGSAAGGGSATIVARADSVIEELGGSQFAELSQEQRWRAVASLGTGLPPSGFTPADLPEPGGTGAGLLQAYCTQCHGLPTPQMHAAAEWPILLRRMLLRMELLQSRVEGPLLSRVGGESLRGALTFRTPPTEEQMDTLRSYLARNALPVARPGEIGTDPGASLFVDRCSVCHETPSPGAHAAAAWDTVVPRMQRNMRLMRVDTLTAAQMNAIEAYLGSHGAR
ncbi:MAG TPA: hypothetical protein VKA44_00555 [Gemmatimonadota bacterium]|nr:hypothetical protein [Gemmatimonadota bacterium]